MVMHYRKQSTKHMETIKVYKLFRRDEVGIHPLFIDKYLCLPIGEWITARAPSDEVMKDVPTGYALIDLIRQSIVEMQAKRPTREQVKRCQLRFCRWVERRDNGHLYNIGLGSDGQVLAFAHRPGWHLSAEPRLPSVDITGKVWAECLIPADDYYIHRVNVSGLTADHQPLEWYISQKIFIVRLVDSPQINHVESTTRGT